MAPIQIHPTSPAKDMPAEPLAPSPPESIRVAVDRLETIFNLINEMQVARLSLERGTGG